MYSSINKNKKKGSKKLQNPEKLPHTMAALQNIESAMKDFKQAVESKKYAFSQQKQAYKKNLAEKNAQLESYAQLAADAMETISQATKQIDMVLEENGSSYNHD